MQIILLNCKRHAAAVIADAIYYFYSMNRGYRLCWLPSTVPRKHTAADVAKASLAQFQGNRLLKNT